VPNLIDLPTFNDERGGLTVIEKILPFEIKRLYYIYNASGKRGGHRHKKSVQALVCIGGSCEVYINDGEKDQTLLLNSPASCLILKPEDWHSMDKFSKNSILLVLASEFYDIDDYIDEAY
jgi:hypothetical protein